ncbi:MAG: 5'-nucleotidase [Brockia lithotrophica]|uniref:5'-nucleotidase n=1 Tax=Brockia lithotrophica TaxID=933949 RepID=A0A2T5GA86_9BACL|nr:MAG: 5'-nucleotidase [Brockia lithotrophica]
MNEIRSRARFRSGLARVILAVLLFSVSLGGLGFTRAEAEAPQAPPDLILLHTNDTHGHLENAPARGTKIAEIRREAEASGKRVLLVDAGDVFTGTLYSSHYRGLADAEFMNRMGYDLLVLGNHEFDRGQDVLAAFVRALAFPVFSANLSVQPDAKLAEVVANEIPVITPATKKDYAGKIYPGAVWDLEEVRVGIFGLTTKETAILSNPGPGVTFRDEVETARRMVEELGKRGADVIVAVTHIGYAEDRRLAQAVPGIDVIVGGHSHTALNPPVALARPDGRATWVAQAGEWGKYLGRLDLSFAFESGGETRLSQAQGELLSLNDVPPDPELKQLLESYDAPLEEIKRRVVGKTLVDLDGARERVRTQETNLGNLIADAYLEKARKAIPETQLALVNGGGIRASIPAGDVTLGQVLEVMPFNNMLVILRLTGAEILEALENGVSKVEDKHGRFPQVAGMRYAFDPARPAGERILRVEVWDEKARTYRPLDHRATYLLVTNNFVADGGDGYEVLKRAKDEGRIVELYEVDHDALVEYLEAHSPVSPRVEGRIERMETATSPAPTPGDGAGAAPPGSAESGDAPSSGNAPASGATEAPEPSPAPPSGPARALPRTGALPPEVLLVVGGTLLAAGGVAYRRSRLEMNG